MYDEPLYMGRVEMRLNNGKKRKYLYFQTDYKLKREKNDGGKLIGTP